MSRRAVAVVVLLSAGCAWDPPFVDFTGKNCGDGDPCPGGFSCVSGVCEVGSGDAGFDAGIQPALPDGGSTDGGVDAGLDGGPADGGLDAGLDGGLSDGGLDAGLDGGLRDGGLDGGPTDDGGVDAGFDAGADAGTCGCTPAVESCATGTQVLQVCLSPPDGGCAAFVPAADCSDAGLVCAGTGPGSAACRCPANGSSDFYADPEQGGDANAGFFSTGVREPAACRLRTLTQALALAGPAAPANVYALTDPPPDGGGFPAGATIATFADATGDGGETYPLALPAGVTLRPYDPAGNGYVAAWQPGDPSAAWILTSSGIAAAIESFSATTASTFHGGGIQCGEGSLTLNGVSLTAQGVAGSAQADGIASDDGCQLDLQNVTVDGFPGNGLRLGPDAGAATLGGTSGCTFHGNGQDGIDALGGSLNGNSVYIPGNAGDGLAIRAGTANLGFLATTGNGGHGLLVSGAATSATLTGFGIGPDSPSNSEVYLLDGALTMAASSANINANQNSCVQALGSSTLSITGQATRIAIVGCSVALDLEGASASITSAILGGSAEGLGPVVSIAGSGTVSISDSSIFGGTTGIVVSPATPSLTLTLTGNYINGNGTSMTSPGGVWFQGPLNLQAFAGNYISSNVGDQVVVAGAGTWLLGGGGACPHIQSGGTNGFLGYSAPGVGIHVTVPGATVTASYDDWTNAPPTPGVDYVVASGSTLDVSNPCGTSFP